MFINACGNDFNLDWSDVASIDNSSMASEAMSSCEVVSHASPSPSLASPISLPAEALMDLSPRPFDTSLRSLQAITPLPALPSFSLDQDDSYLWNYFSQCVIHQCAVDDISNPYRNVILRLAASSPGGPLFQCVLAASANQLRNLGHMRFDNKAWKCRANALSLVRKEVGALPEAMENLTLASAAQIISSTAMFCFFEVSIYLFIRFYLFVVQFIFTLPSSNHQLRFSPLSLRATAC